MKQYKAVFIDWDDTIGDFIGAAKLALQEMYEKYNLSDYFASLEEFVSLYKPHNLELWDKYGKDLVTKEFLRVDRFLWPLLHGSKNQNSKFINSRRAIERRFLTSYYCSFFVVAWSRGVGALFGGEIPANGGDKWFCRSAIRKV